MPSFGIPTLCTCSVLNLNTSSWRVFDGGMRLNTHTQKVCSAIERARTRAQSPMNWCTLLLFCKLQGVCVCACVFARADVRQTLFAIDAKCGNPRRRWTASHSAHRQTEDRPGPGEITHAKKLHSDDRNFAN